jgi:hypothetical protein
VEDCNDSTDDTGSVAEDSADDTGSVADANDQEVIPDGDDDDSSKEDFVPADDKDSADDTGSVAEDSADDICVADDTGDVESVLLKWSRKSTLHVSPYKPLSDEHALHLRKIARQIQDRSKYFGCIE